MEKRLRVCTDGHQTIVRMGSSGSVRSHRKGAELSRILFTIEDIGLKDRVRLLGSMKAYEIRERLQGADAFVLSSLSEGISNAALEAMACGIPIVTTNCGGMEEAVEDGVEGFVVSIRDADAMARALRTLWQEPGLRRQMGSSRSQRIIRQFNLENQIEEFRKLFYSVTDFASPLSYDELAQKFTEMHR